MRGEARIQTQKCDSGFHILTSACFHLGPRGLFKEGYERITDFLHSVGGSVGFPWAELSDQDPQGAGTPSSLPATMESTGLKAKLELGVGKLEFF